MRLLAVFTPPRLGCRLCDLASFFRREICRSRYTALETTLASQGDGMWVLTVLPGFRGQRTTCSGLNDAQSVLDGV